MNTERKKYIDQFLEDVYLKQYYDTSHPKNVCICGRLAYLDEMLYMESMINILTESDVAFAPLPLNCETRKRLVESGCSEEESQEILQKIHNTKIDISEIVIICNFDYIGEHTRREIQYAESNNKLVLYLKPVE